MHIGIRRRSGAGFIVALAFLAILSPPNPLAAQVEVEVDPFAYALNGFSLHVAKMVGPTRVNVGTFGIDIPAAYHGNEGWTSSMRGAGVKWDYIGSTPYGFFVGADGGFMRARYALEGDGNPVSRNVIGVGLRGGYRQPIGRSGLYLAPWASLSYQFDGDEVISRENQFDRSPIAPFATVHIGWRF